MKKGFGSTQGLAPMGVLFILAVAGLLLAPCLTGLLLARYTLQLDGDGLKVYSPPAQAQATRIAQAAADEAAARALERQAQAANQPARQTFGALFWTIAFIVTLIVGVGSAFAVVAWLNKRATAVYPNSAGQYPVIVRRNLGGATLIHDPNRAIGPTTLYTTPSLLDDLLSLARPRSPQPTPSITAQYPQPASEATMLRVTTQAQIGQAAAAHNRWPNLPAALANRLALNIKEATDRRPPELLELPSRLGEIQVVENAREVEKIDRWIMSS